MNSKSHPADQVNDEVDGAPATFTQFEDRPFKVCLLCSSVCIKEVKDEVISFFLEQLMCFSVEELQKKYVALNDLIMENLNLCGTCITFVKDAERIYAEWKTINAKMKEIENEIRTKLQKSELSQDMFQENTILFQLYEDIRNNLNSKKGEMPSISGTRTKNIASFYNLGMDVPEFVSKNKKTRSRKFEESIENEIDTEMQVKIENMEEEELDFGVIESVTGMMASDDELESDSSPIHQGDDDDWVPSDGTLDNELSHFASAVKTKSSRTRRKRKFKECESISSPMQKPIDEWVPSDNNMEGEQDSSEYDSTSSTKKVKSSPKRNLRERKSSLLNNSPPKSRTGINYKNRNTKMLIKCTLCKGEYTDKSSVTDHFISQHKTNCKFLRQEVINDETGITYLSYYGADSSKPCKEKPKRPESHSCPEENCLKTYSTEKGLKLHLVQTHKHPKTTSYDCELCDYKTKQKYRLKFHMMTHTGEKPELCSYCGLSYKRKESLADHIRIKHTLEKPFSCQFCKENFTTLDKVYQHMKKTHLKQWSSLQDARKASGYSKPCKFVSEENEKKSNCESKSSSGNEPVQASIFDMDSQNVAAEVDIHPEINRIFDNTICNSSSNVVSQPDWSFMMH